MAKRYVIEQYEIHTHKVVVEADSEAEAVANYLLGKVYATPVDNSTEFIEIDNDRGICMDEDELLCMEVQQLGVRLDRNEFIPSIRSVTEE